MFPNGCGNGVEVRDGGTDVEEIESNISVLSSRSISTSSVQMLLFGRSVAGACSRDLLVLGWPAVCDRLTGSGSSFG